MAPLPVATGGAPVTYLIEDVLVFLVDVRALPGLGLGSDIAIFGDSLNALKRARIGWSVDLRIPATLVRARHYARKRSPTRHRSLTSPRRSPRPS